MYKATEVRSVDLQPGMRLACHMADGSIQPTGTVVRTVATYGGGLDIVIRGARGTYTQHEDEVRLANGCTVQVAVQA